MAIRYQFSSHKKIIAIGWEDSWKQLNSAKLAYKTSVSYKYLRLIIKLKMIMNRNDDYNNQLITGDTEIDGLIETAL